VGKSIFKLDDPHAYDERRGFAKKKPTKKWARNTGSNVSNVVLNT
jgi:hypothetical protein